MKLFKIFKKIPQIIIQFPLPKWNLKYLDCNKNYFKFLLNYFYGYNLRGNNTKNLKIHCVLSIKTQLRGWTDCSAFKNT